MIDKILKFLSVLTKELYIFIISLLPIVELRGSVPVGAAIGLPFYTNYIVSVIGNLLPVPFVLLLMPKIIDFMARFRFFRPIANWLKDKAEKHKDKIIKPTAEEADEENKKEARLSTKIFMALLLFVAIPLPGTGAWTGSLVAALFNLPKRSSFLAIALGVMTSGVIMCLASYGVIGFLSFLT